MKNPKITLSFPVRLNTDGNGFSYIDDTRLATSCYGMNGSAIKQLKAGLQSEVNLALDNRANSRKRIIVCNDGTVLVCEYSGGFMYSSCHNTRDYAGSAHGDWKTFDDMLASARKHAEGSYGGIAWESSF